MFDLNETFALAETAAASPNHAPLAQRGGHYPQQKRLFDLAICATLSVAMTAIIGVLLLLNPILNRGPLFYVQDRMGRDCKPFRAIKFRSMTEADGTPRGPFDPLDRHRITRLGRFLRASRIDELPQIINVFRGDMSLIGPRPDSLSHAQAYVLAIPGYRERHSVLPGISGYAQIEVGYVDGLEGIRRKVMADHVYLRTASLQTDMWLALRTMGVVFLRKGA